ncbi:hypothetical protein Ptr86124_013894, partial [Pyrenophora tritici-repentis]
PASLAEASPVPAVPFQAWQALQTEHATKHKCPSGVAQDEVASGESLSYWGIEPDAVKRGSVVSKQFALNEQTTSALLGPCNDVFQTRPVELMLAALAHSFAIAFSDRAPPTIFNESHGREPWDAGIDLSRTVGWFTSMLPIQVPSHTRGDLLEVIRHTKDGMRKFPDNGRSYFASRFADADTSDVFTSMFPVEVIFNYQGVYQQLERTDSLFKTLPAPDGCEPASMLEAPRFALFDVSAVVEKGRMHVTVTSDSKAKRQQQVANWIERYEMALVEMATLLQKKHKQWTLSDLPLAFKTYEDLDSFQNDTLAELGVQPEEVEDVFPCLPMQEGILISQSRDPDAYRVSFIFEVIPTQQNQVNCTRLQQAWEAVHIILPSSGDTATLAMFRAHQDTLAQQDSGLQHRMFICQLDNGKAYLCLDINHAIFDAHSRGVILRDLQSAYSANLNPDSGRFRDVVSYLTQQEQEETHAYWARYLDGVEPCFFSSMAEPQDVCYRDGTVHVPDIDANAVHTFCQTWDITIATIIQTAWALVLSRYTGATTPCFGNLSSRRDLPVEDVANIFGPLITTIACRVQLDEHKTVMDVLRAVQSDYTNSLPHQNISLASVHSMLGLGANALFNTILSLQRIDDTMAVNDSEIDFRGQSGSDPTEYAINIGAGYNRSVMEIEIHYQTRCIDDAQAANLAESLSQAIYGIITKTTSTIGDLQILSKRQQQQLWKWNGEVPPVVERCVHELFVEQARARPDAAAICAWDGEMKYGELDELSSRLAGYLVGLGVGPEAIVPLCFEKSMWTVVAMLAVLKAGGAFAPLDPEHPASRHEEIFRQTGARVVLASAQHSTLCSGGNRTVVVVSEAAMRELPSEASEASTTDKRTTTRTKAQPDNPAYVLFTSGSTGKPKGVVIEHRAILTSCLGHGKAFNLTSDSRFLQFSSYTFDVSIIEIWTMLLVGGCTCVPSESDKKDDLSKAINALDANWAFLTPTVAKLLDPERIPGLQNLILGAELVTDHDWNRWSPYALQITAYGPTECCVLCIFYSGTLGFYTGLLGKSVASVSWVVDPNDHNKLAPLGAVGELLVEGPILARGYLNDAEKTAAAFIDDPAWLLEGCDQHAGRRGRLYKTGDLVHYDADGNLVYVNRKDAQVKVRGQRVELGEIEHHVRECMPEVGRMAVEVIMPGDDKDKATVAVFVEQKEEEVSDGDGSSARVFFPSQVDSQLSERLPSYMVPGVYFSVAQLPMTTSGKTDRKRLREIGATFSAQQLAELRTRSQGPKRQPSTDKEKAMQQLWAQVLNIDADSIGLDDSFFRLGGDSIAAMKLVAEARKQNVPLTVAATFQHPRLVDLAAWAGGVDPAVAQSIVPFSLLNINSDVDTARIQEEVAAGCNIDKDLVEDIYPCSPLQEGLMSLTSKRAGDYIMQSVLELSVSMDESALRAAWEQVVKQSMMLRTRIVQHSRLGLLQVVVAGDIQWMEADHLGTYLAEDKAASMQPGDCLARYAFVKERDGGRRWFVWTMHHALYDGWSLPRILGAVEKAYNGGVLEERPGFNAFVQYLSQQDQEATTNYWQTTLAGCEATMFPPLPPSIHQPVANAMLEHQCPPLPRTMASDTTTSTLIRAAWAIVAGNYTSSDDVVFGATVTGRNAPVAGIEDIVGPAIATVPVRVRLPRDWTVPALLAAVQQQATEMIPYEQTGLQRIAKMGADAQHACGFQTLLIVQPADDGLESDKSLGRWQTKSELQDFTTYALMVQCTLATERVQITASFDPQVIEQWQVQRMLGQLGFVAQQLAEAGGKTTVAEIDTLTPEDRQQLWKWNGEVPPVVERCVHELFVEQARARPDAAAICAWDGEMKYGELDELSSRLAGYLVGLGVGPEAIVPLCFEKSMWTVVAMLAVLKAGGAFAPLDPEHPASRHEEIFRQTGARVVLASAQHSTLCSGGNRTVVVVSEAAMRELPSEASEASTTDKRTTTRTKAQPDNPAYVLFTSGSTGKPKGVVIEHRAILTSCLGHGKAFNLTSDSRFLQFSSYTFDVSITEIWTTLLMGGCTCVPSESDKKDDLLKAINALDANWAHLTPTVAKLLDPERIPGLQNLILGAELVTDHDWNRWSPYARQITTYGPTECCVLCTFYSGTLGFYTGLLGKSVASVSWVVDPNDHHKLAPLGAVGELLVEGPILARGYLNDAEKTAAAFIDDPAWLLEGCDQHAGRRGRLYKTGDLVHYDADGNLVYVNRKDAQVKVRGQRVELGEIEHHVRECMPEVGRMAVEVIMPGDDKDKATVAVFVEQKEEEVSDGDGSSARVFFPSQVDSQLSERLPSYMVPGVYFSVAQLPMTTSGKTDRKRLREIGATFSAQQLAELRTRSQGPKRQPSTDKEKAMQQLWAQVLNIDADSIGLDDSFFRLGGDSITAMQVSSTARSLQISVTTADILEQKTISRLAHRMSRNHFSSNLVMEDPVNRHFSLTPIQELYLRLESTGSACFDQSFFLELSSLTNLESLRAAFKTLVRRHSMLRALFSQTAGGRWQQHISDRGSASFTVDYVRCIDSKDVSEAIRQSRDGLDVQNGPVLAAVLCDQGQRQLLFIAIHHLVIDLVSWRVLLEELEDLLLSRKLPAVPAVPFQAWQALQTEHATKHKCPSGVAQDEVASGESLSYWGIEPDAVKRGSVVSKQFALNEQTTSALLGPCNDVFQTRPVELMLAALAHSFAIAFSDRAPPTIFNESHGREPWDAGIDLSRTVGWFTSMLPIQVPSHTRGDLLEVIRHTKDGMRKFPDNGRSYFASRFADADTSDVFASMFPVEVIFNYQGVYQQLERTDSLFKTLPAPDGCEPASMLEAPRFALFDVSAVVEKGRMHVTVTSDSKAKRQQQVANWIERYEMALVEMATLLQKKHKQWTLSDLPLAFKTYEDLDSFQNDTLAELGVQPEEVEDVFPCLPMQEGILISQSRDPDAYRVSSIFEVIPTQQNQVNCTRLQQAWEAVVRRHSLLRALLVDNVPGSLGTTNVVLKDPQPSISFFRAAGDTATLAMFRAHQDTLAQQDSGLQHRMFICQLDNGKAYLCLDINHAIFDAHSRGVILRDLQSAYSANLNPDSGRFRDVVSYLTQQEQEETHAYWARYLDGVEPCFFSSMAEPQDVCYRDGTVHVPDIDANAVHTFCQTWDITIATIIQTAWALVLSRYTGATTPCFGNLSSRRDLPVEDVANIFGPLITTIACRVQLDEHKTVMDVLRAVQSDYTNSLPHQNISLASVHSMLGLGANALFNTILSLQRIDDTMAVNDSEIDFRGQSGSDPTEYAINIGAGYNRSVMEIEIHYQTRCIDDAQAANLAESLSQAIYGIITKTTSTIGDLQILSKRQQQQLWKWNGEVPPVVERCVHELFVEQARARPDAAAICAWDGEMKYGELDELSSRLAGYLVGLGVGPEAIVPLCFEKSMWTVVAMLAVLKAGGAFAPLDPEHPASRHEEIFRQTGARVVLASAQHSTLCSGGNRTVVVVSKASFDRLSSASDKANVISKPSSIAYVMFTSGSTGTPKGVVLEHRAISTSCLTHGEAFGFSPSTRSLQFAAYTFDACITEIITALLFGACICVPSELDRRNDLSNISNTLKVSWALLTPTVARTLDPKTIPSLRTLVLGGEQVSRVDWERWSHLEKQINTYGPTECSVWCTSHSNVAGFTSGTIGKLIASVGWVVDPNDHNRLAPLGSVGELLVEGPILARGYLNDAEKTAAAFIDDPAWLLEGSKEHAGRHAGRHGRLYKTGDLVHYDADGNLVYVGRKDGQVKVRGQRVELGEIEHHVRECMPEVGRMAVEVIMPGDDKDKATVAVFVEQKEPIQEGESTPPKMKGSAMLVRARTREEVVERLKNDIYVSEGVWDWDKAQIFPFKSTLRKAL